MRDILDFEDHMEIIITPSGDFVVRGRSSFSPWSSLEYVKTEWNCQIRFGLSWFALGQKQMCVEFSSLPGYESHHDVWTYSNKYVND